MEYKVMLLDRCIDSTKFIFDKIDQQLDMYKRAYATEMSIMNSQPLQMFQFEDSQICVAFTEDYRVLGFLAFGYQSISNVIFVEHVYVEPSFRKQGIYKLMMKRIEKLATDMKADKIAAFVFTTNTDSMKAHMKLGLRPCITGFMKEISNDNQR